MIQEYASIFESQWDLIVKFWKVARIVKFWKLPVNAWLSIWSHWPQILKSMWTSVYVCVFILWSFCGSEFLMHLWERPSVLVIPPYLPPFIPLSHPSPQFNSFSSSLFSYYKNQIIKFTRKWIELETIILSKAMETQKDQPHMFSLCHSGVSFESSDVYDWFIIPTEVRNVVKTYWVQENSRERQDLTVL